VPSGRLISTCEVTAVLFRRTEGRGNPAFCF
jgi:hypothetical protein